MSHDRSRLSALVDGELDHDDRDRVLSHLTRCDECRAVVDTERRVKALLGGMPEPGLSDDFMTSLFGMAEPDRTRPEAPAGAPPGAAEGASGEGSEGVSGDVSGGVSGGTAGQVPAQVRPAPAARPAPGGTQKRALPAAGGRQRQVSFRPVPFRQVSFRPAALRPGGYPGRARRPGGRPGRGLPIGLAGAASLAGMALVTAFAIGGQPSASPDQQPVRPPVARFTIQHADNAAELPLSDSGATTAIFGDAGRTGWGLIDR